MGALPLTAPSWSSNPPSVLPSLQVFSFSPVLLKLAPAFSKSARLTVYLSSILCLDRSARLAVKTLSNLLTLSQLTLRASKVSVSASSIPKRMLKTSGNSGGPVVDLNTLAVVGICRSGGLYPFVAQSQGSTQQQSSLKTGVDTWRSTKTINVPPPPNQISYPEIDEEYLHSYVETKTDLYNKKLFWNRFLPTSGIIKELNCFTRVDAYALISQALSRFSQSNAAAKRKVSIQLSVNFSTASPGTLSSPIRADFLNISGNRLEGEFIPLKKAPKPGDRVFWELTDPTKKLRQPPSPPTEYNAP